MIIKSSVGFEDTWIDEVMRSTWYSGGDSILLIKK